VKKRPQNKQDSSTRLETSPKPIEGPDTDRESEHTLKTVFDTLDYMIFVLDMQGNMLNVSGAVTKKLGYTEEELVGRNVLMVHPEERREEAGRIVSDMVAGKLGYCPVPLITKAGRLIPVKTRVAKGTWHGQEVLLGISKDISDLKASEEKFSHVFHANPAPMAISTLAEGRFVEVNEAFLRTMGYEREEIIGKTSAQLGLYADPRQRDALRPVLEKNGFLSNIEVYFLAKGGNLRYGLFSAELIRLQNEEFLLTVMDDVTDRRKAEGALQSVLKLNSRIDSMTVSEGMQFALDEAERLTDSKVGFFHFVNPDEETIELIAWSTETRKHCYVPSEPERHYPVSKAGVWADALHQRKPVFHNDYPSLSHRKGLPEGHVTIHREAVVPIFEGDRIVAIIGVGNKPTDYDSNDVNLLSLLAKNTWTSIRRKKAEESLKASEEKYRSIFENSVEGIFQSTPEGRFLSVNPALARMAGYESPREMMESITDLGAQLYVHPEDRDRFQKIMEEKGTVENLEHEQRCKDGSIIWVSNSAHAVRDHKGRILYYEGINEDITKRKSAEEALRVSEKKFSDAFRSSPATFTITSRKDLRVVDVNERFISMYGYERDEVIGRTVLELGLFPGTEELFKGLRVLTEKGVLRDFEYTFRRKNGEIGHGLMGATMIDIAGEPHILSGSIDITDRKKIEKVLAESEERWNFALEGSGDGVWDWNAETNEVFFSRQWKAMLGFEEDEMGNTLDEWDKRVHPEDKPHVYEEINKHFAGQKPEYTSEHRVLCKDGRYKWILDRGKVVSRSEDGKPLRVIGTHSDITDRKRAEETLRESRESLKKAQAIAHLGSWEWDPRANQVTASKETFRIFGMEDRPFEDFISFAQRIHPDDRGYFDHTMSEWLRNARGGELEYRVVQPDGSVRYIHAQGEVVCDEKGSPVKLFGTVHDMTERKVLGEELLRIQKLESIGTLAGGIAHDFNNLLQAIMGYINLMKLKLADDNGIYRFISGAEEATRKASDLTKQLITFSKGGAPLKKMTPLKDLLENTILLSLSGTNIHPSFLIEDDLSPVYVDEGQIRQVVHNVITNACEAMPKGGIVAVEAKKVQITEGMPLPLRKGPYALISIIDTGCGIPEENLSKIFDPYFTTKQMGPHKGMGLGLAVCYSIMKYHDGHIAVESTVDKGTKVHLYIPAAPAMSLDTP
jgi:two-component system cell cycle sensor histidine kinase/response regulator CckA